MAAFVCPNCGEETNLLFYAPTRRGEVPRKGCSLCFKTLDVPRDRKHYTGRKCWAGGEVYTRAKSEQLTKDLEERTLADVAKERRHMRPSLKAKLGW